MEKLLNALKETKWRGGGTRRTAECAERKFCCDFDKLQNDPYFGRQGIKTSQNSFVLKKHCDICNLLLTFVTFVTYVIVTLLLNWIFTNFGFSL